MVHLFLGKLFLNELNIVSSRSSLENQCKNRRANSKRIDMTCFKQADTVLSSQSYMLPREKINIEISQGLYVDKCGFLLTLPPPLLVYVVVKWPLDKKKLERVNMFTTCFHEFRTYESTIFFIIFSCFPLKAGRIFFIEIKKVAKYIWQKKYAQ